MEGDNECLDAKEPRLRLERFPSPVLVRFFSPSLMFRSVPQRAEAILMGCNNVYSNR